MIRRGALAFALFGLVLLSALATGPVVSGQQVGAGGSASGDAPSLAQLYESGNQVTDAPPSTRWFSEGYGGVQIRHDPADPFDSKEWYYLGQQDVVRVDSLTLVSQRYGDDVSQQDYELRVAYWQPDSRRVETNNGTVVTRQFANISRIETKSFSLGTRYDRAQIDLRRTSDEPHYVTMCMQKAGSDGDCLTDGGGPRWAAFEHKSMAARSPVDINSVGDALSWVTMNMLVFAVPGTFVAAGSARSILKRTGAGPMLGYLWLVAIAFIGFLLVAGAFVATARVVARMPQIIGMLIPAIVFIVFIEAFDGRVRRVLFERHELMDSISPSGDEVKDAMFQDVEEHRMVKLEDSDEWQLVKPGIRPFLARLWARGATIAPEDLKTRIEIKSNRWDRKYIADPRSEDVLHHEPAKLVWDPPLTTERETEGIVGLLESINGKFVLAAVGGLYLGLQVGDVMWNLPMLGALVGLAPALWMSIRAEDGWAEFVPAPQHTTQAQATIAHEQQVTADGRTIEELEDIAWSERTRTMLEAREVQSRFDKTVTQRMHEDTLGLRDIEDDEDDAIEDDVDERRNGHGHPASTEASDD